MAAAVASTQADHSYISSTCDFNTDFDSDVLSSPRDEEMIDSDEDIDIMGIWPQDCSTPLKQGVDDMKQADEVQMLESMPDRPVPFVQIYGIEHLLRLFG